MDRPSRPTPLLRALSRHLIPAAVAVATGLAAPSVAGAQDEPPPAPPQMVLAGELAVITVLGDWAETAGVGFGAMGRVDYALGPKLALSVHPGFIYHFAANDITTTEILALGGARFSLVPEFSLFGETGLNVIRASADGGSDSAVRVPVNVGVGYLGGGVYTASVSLFVPNVLLREEGESTHMGLMANVGYFIGR
jgi:hypothetical protein